MVNPRDPLTLRVARTVRETRRDPSDWWEGAREPASYVVGFAGAMRPSRRTRLQRLLRALRRWLRAPSPWEFNR